MVKMSSRLSDFIILTLDDLNGILYEEMVGQLHLLNEANKGIVIPDRTLAIEYAVKNARKGDWIVITGKGTETYQQTFSLPARSDVETVRFVCSQ